MRDTLRNQKRQLRDRNNELLSPPGSLIRARNQHNGWESDEDTITFENARNAAVTAFNKENFNYLQEHVPSVDVEEEGEGSNVLLRVVKTTTNTTNVKRTVLAAIQSCDGEVH